MLWRILFLVLIALGALVPGGTLRLYDAESLEPAESVARVELPVSYSLSEPFSSLAREVVASGAWVAEGLAWLLTLVMAFALLLPLTGLASRKEATALGFLFAAYVAYFVFSAPLAPAKLVAPDDAWQIVDIHSHTYFSHDGFVSPQGNVERHLAAGFTAWGVTEHGGLDGAYAVRNLASAQSEQATVLIGEELRGWPIAHYLVFGQLWSLDDQEFRKDHVDLLAEIEKRGYAIIPSKWWKQEAMPLDELILWPVHGFEVFNPSYVGEDDGARQRLITEARERSRTRWLGLDWHGWGNFIDAWTLLYAPVLRGKTMYEREELFVGILKGTVPSRQQTLLLSRGFETKQTAAYARPLIGIYNVWRGLDLPGRAMLLLYSTLFFCGLRILSARWLARLAALLLSALVLSQAHAWHLLSVEAPPWNLALSEASFYCGLAGGVLFLLSFIGVRRKRAA